MNGRYKTTGLLILLASLIRPCAGLAQQDTFNASINVDGVVQGDGSGYGGGQWYRYPNTGWYNQWFYDGPFNPNGQKTITWKLTMAPATPGAAGRVTIAINWTTDRWTDTTSPPLPGQFVNNPTLEDQMITRVTVFDGPVTGPGIFPGNISISSYCPVWVSIDVKGANVTLSSGTITHQCVSQQNLYDWGDAPDPPYPTLNAHGGASHLIDNKVYLGATVNGEPDGQPNATATGDSDDDGVTFTSPLTPGSTASVNVVASASGILEAWIDFNGNGNWADPGDQIFTDLPLVGGVNSLTFPVPASAVPGNTFARFRYSSVKGLTFKGPAPNGEVEDYEVKIEQPKTVGDLKWDQPPIEYDPRALTPVFCGWDEPAYVYNPVNPVTGIVPSWKLVADDFRCIGSMPVTSVHWWGSYSGWAEPNSAPGVQPSTWLVGFWSNVSATATSFSHPGRLLQVVRVPASQVSIVSAGIDRFSGKPSDSCYEYTVALNSDQYFFQNKYLTNTADNVFWLSITAIYTSVQPPTFPWGWKTRPAHWMDDAVTFSVQAPDVPVGYQPSSTAMSPIQNSAVCQQAASYDMCFALDTLPSYVKWDQPFTGLDDWPHYEDQPSMATLTQASSIALKWQQLPDLRGTGVDMDATMDSPTTWPAVIEADDFQCTVPGPLTGIDIWGSWYFDILPDNDANNVEFTLSIHKDIPAPPATVAGYSRPGAVLWSKTFAPKDFTVSVQNSEPESYYHPILDFYLPSSDNHVYRYHFTVDSNEAFRQTGTTANPVTYWLSVQAHLIRKAGDCATRWGWKTSVTQWNDTPVYAAGTDANTAAWKILGYPPKHPLSGQKLGLAFQLTTGDQSSGLLVQSQVADDWLCNSRNPITAAVWWGSYPGYNYQPCACQTQTAPKQPYYFWLSIWTDVPATPSSTGVSTYSRPGQLVWQYNAYDYDEVLVGFDKHPEGVTAVPIPGYEPVYRYSVSIPRTNWFYQPGANQVYWFSVVAVFQDAKIPYKWGWTNHSHAFNDDAVTTVSPYSVPFVGGSLFWTPLFDQTNKSEDMSFTLFTDPTELPPK